MSISLPVLKTHYNLSHPLQVWAFKQSYNVHVENMLDFLKKGHVEPLQRVLAAPPVQLCFTSYASFCREC